MSHPLDAKLADALRRISSVSGDDSVVAAAADAKQIYEEVLADPAASRAQRAAAISGLGDVQSLGEVYGDAFAPPWAFYAVAAILDPSDPYKLVSMAAEMYLSLGAEHPPGRLLLNSLIHHILEHHALSPSQQQTLDQVVAHLRKAEEH